MITSLSRQPIVIMNPWVHGNSKVVITDPVGAYDNLEMAGGVGSENFTPIELEPHISRNTL